MSIYTATFSQDCLKVISAGGGIAYVSIVPLGQNNILVKNNDFLSQISVALFSYQLWNQGHTHIELIIYPAPFILSVPVINAQPFQLQLYNSHTFNTINSDQ